MSPHIDSTHIDISVPSVTTANDGTCTDVAELQRQLSGCLEALDALRHEQDVLARGISHDLRAPLRAIDNFSSLVAANPSLDESARSHLARVRAAATRMGGLIDALLELSRANRAELKREAVDMSLLFEWVGAELQEAEPARAATIDVASGLHVHGDERLLKLLAGELLGNAWKFSRERDAVCIRVTGAREADAAGTRMHLAVSDAGCGFDMRYAPKLFEPFQRLLGPEQGGGNGMGLAIVQRIAQRHGGRTWVESEPGVGSTFHVDLPAADAAVA